MKSLEFLKFRHIFPESPRWHEAEQALYFCDIIAGTIWRLPAGADEPEFVLKLNDWIHGFALDREGNLLVCSARLRRVLRFRKGFRDSNDFEVVADLFPYCRGFLNELIVTDAGHIYVSVIDFILSKGDDFLSQVVRSSIVRIAPDGSVGYATRMTNGPNGMVGSPDGRRLYVADTFDGCVYAFAIQADGSLADGRVFAKWEGEAPDGMCMDADGCFWTASLHRVFRFKEGGEILESIDVGEDHAIACALGGPDRRTLYVQTVRLGGMLEMADQPPTARLGFTRVETPGAGKPSQYLDA